MSPKSKNRWIIISLLLSLWIGGVFRFFNLNWDQGHFFHPDERNIAAAVSRIRFFRQLNPQFFAYGGFPIYLYRAIGEVVSGFTRNPAWISNWGLINLIGRGVSAFVSLLSILLVFFLGKKVFGKKVGLLAAFFTAFCVSLIQTAHYGVTESLLCFWGLFIALLSFKLLEEPIPMNYLILGVISGLAIGTKISAATFLIFPVLAHFLSGKKGFWKKQLFLLPFCHLALLWFFISSPYTFLDFKHFKESMSYEGGIVSGKLMVCYVYQFLKTTPYLFQIKNLPWLMGPLSAFFSVVGLVALIIKILKGALKQVFLRTGATHTLLFERGRSPSREAENLRRDREVLDNTKDKEWLRSSWRKEIILISWPLAYFAIIGSWFVKFVRYTVPLLPFFCIFAAWILLEIRKRWHGVGLSLILISTLSTVVYALGFMSIYTYESTRITASKWIYQNIPEGSKILNEHWDDGLPINLNEGKPRQYQTEQLTIYEPDNEEKIEYYGERLAGADYIIINSRRLYGTLMNLAERYPITSHYYKLLFSGRLGYKEIAEFSSYPQILGVEIKTDAAEETFQVYDHPKVMVFQNQERFNKEVLVQKLSW